MSGMDLIVASVLVGTILLGQAVWFLKNLNSLFTQFLFRIQLLSICFGLQLHPCSVSAELEKLIDRENELLARGFSNRSMDGLRKRITNLFLQYIKLPMVNPDAARFSKVSDNS